MNKLAEITLQACPQEIGQLSKEDRKLLWDIILRKTKEEGLKMQSHPSVEYEYLWEGVIELGGHMFRCRGYTVESEWVMRCTVNEWGPIQFVAGYVVTFGYDLGPWCPAWALPENTEFLRGRHLFGTGPGEPCASSY